MRSPAASAISKSVRKRFVLSLRSAVGTNLTGPLDLVPGAYGADSGRALGGLVLVGTRELPAQGVHGAAEVNLLDSSLMLAAAPSTRFRFGVAGTWSYLDRYHARLDEATTTFYQVPRYRDFQAKVELDVARQRRLTLLVLGAAEQVRPSDELTGVGPTDPLAGNDWLLQRNRTWSRIAIQYADGRIVRGTRHLGREDVATLFVNQQQVRKRAAHVNP